MSACAAAWAVSAANPANEEREAPTAGPLAWRAAATAAGEGAAAMDVDAPISPSPGEEASPEDAAAAAAAEEAEEIELVETLPPIDANASEHWQLGAFAFASVGGYDMDSSYVPAAFLNEYGRDPALRGSFGPLGLASLAEVRTRARAPPRVSCGHAVIPPQQVSNCR